VDTNLDTGIINMPVVVTMQGTEMYENVSAWVSVKCSGLNNIFFVNERHEFRSFGDSSKSTKQ